MTKDAIFRICVYLVSLISAAIAQESEYLYGGWQRVQRFFILLLVALRLPRVSSTAGRWSSGFHMIAANCSH